MMSRFGMKFSRLLLIIVIAGLLLFLFLTPMKEEENEKAKMQETYNSFISNQPKMHKSLLNKISKHMIESAKLTNTKEHHLKLTKQQELPDLNWANQKPQDSEATQNKLPEGRDVPFDKKLDIKEQHCLDFKWGGSLFNNKGRLMKISRNVTSCLAHSFSPYIERETAKRFVDPPHDQVYYANSPAVKWHNGELVLVARMWLDREKYEPNESWPPNHFADNWLYTQKYDQKLAPANSASIMGIPLPKQWWVGDGPIEPRLFRLRGHLYISFNAAMSFTRKQAMDFTILYDYDRNIPLIPKIKGGTPMINATEKNDMPRDKHWMALVHKNKNDGINDQDNQEELYFVHNLDPLRVMHCNILDTEADCKFVHDERDNKGFIFEHHVSHLRGGTPFELYRDNYYISIAHSTMYKTSNHHRYYSTHLVVLYAKPETAEYRIAYVSDDIKLHKKIYAAAPMVRPRWIEDDFMFPVGLLVESANAMIIGGHLNDFSSVLIRVKGMEDLMNKVIEEDGLRNLGLKQGPPIGYLQKYIHDLMENLTDYKFVH